MKLDYVMLNPTGNITALVKSPVEIGQQPFVAARIMEKEPTCEQVGFVVLDGVGASLRMAGGEFCGNAAMSAAALWHLENGREGPCTVEVRVSGTKKPVRVTVEPLPEGGARCCVEMPEPLSVTEVTLPFCGQNYPLTAVNLGGIIHLVTETPFEVSIAERAVRQWCRLLSADALGLMQLKGDTLTPLVCVPGADTLFWEHSCASGTAAVGAARRRACGSAVHLDLRQPGGILAVDAPSAGPIRLTGHVCITKRLQLEV